MSLSQIGYFRRALAVIDLAAESAGGEQMNMDDADICASLERAGTWKKGRKIMRRKTSARVEAIRLRY